MIASIKRAAELSALAERTRNEALRNATYDPVSIARLEGAAHRRIPKGQQTAFRARA